MMPPKGYATWDFSSLKLRHQYAFAKQTFEWRVMHLKKMLYDKCYKTFSSGVASKIVSLTKLWETSSFDIREIIIIYINRGTYWKSLHEYSLLMYNPAKNILNLRMKGRPVILIDRVSNEITDVIELCLWFVINTRSTGSGSLFFPLVDWLWNNWFGRRGSNSARCQCVVIYTGEFRERAE